jgi:low affinity Fe/Cu permease
VESSPGLLFSRFAHWTARQTGRPPAFMLALATVVVWAVTGPLFGWSDTWQLVINTGTTIVTFLMVFLIQSTQNRDTDALHVKLDELIRTNKAARNSLISLEQQSEAEIAAVRDAMIDMAEPPKKHARGR